MNIEILSKQKDNRSNCVSVLCETSVGEYLDFIKTTYQERGNIAEQRDVLSTKSAITIRNRMVEDSKQGAILPPIVLGITTTSNLFQNIESPSTIDSQFKERVTQLLTDDGSTVALIDGMQRTTALKMAAEAHKDVRSLIMRLELWITERSNTLLYRMLVLNTGQIPWDTRKQLEVIFRSVTKDVKTTIPSIRIFSKEDKDGRIDSKQYQANHLIEMFIAFSSRTEKLNPKERISQEFTRIDLVESTNGNDIVDFFIRALIIFCQLDDFLCHDKSEGIEESRFFKNGYELMYSQPLRVGFMAAMGVRIFGKPGRDRNPHERTATLVQLESEFKTFFDTVKDFTPSQVKEFLSLDTLNGMRPKTSSRIGEHDRKFFKEAFGEMFKTLADLPTMESCWREAE